MGVGVVCKYSWTDSINYRELSWRYHSSPSPITLTFEATNVTASSSDYNTANVQITIPANTTAATVMIPTTDDAIQESDETLTLSVLSVDSGAVGDVSDTGLGTIQDDDSAPSLTISDAIATEGDALLFSITLSSPSATDTAITFTPTTGTADNSDFDQTPVQITIPAGSTAATVSVPTTDDGVTEPDETMTLHVTSVDAGSLSDSTDTGAGTIEDFPTSGTGVTRTGSPNAIPTLGQWGLYTLIMFVIVVVARDKRLRALLEQ